MVRSEIRGQNCLGKLSRDTGHKRVPDPPDKITGTIGPAVFIVFLACNDATTYSNPIQTLSSTWIEAALAIRPASAEFAAKPPGLSRQP